MHPLVGLVRSAPKQELFVSACLAPSDIGMRTCYVQEVNLREQGITFVSK